MRAEIITIGDELLIGQVVDTNSAWMAQKLNEQGIELYQINALNCFKLIHLSGSSKTPLSVLKIHFGFLSL